MSLFPLISQADSAGEMENTGLPLYREVEWSFETNEPVWRGGAPSFVTGGAAVLVWAWNALHAERFGHDVYSHDYGADFAGLLGRACTEEVRQAEAKRIVQETLLVNPYITAVEQVETEFEGSTLRIRCRIRSIYGEVRMDECDITV